MLTRHTSPAVAETISNAPAFVMCATVGMTSVPGATVAPFHVAYAYAFAQARRQVVLDRFRRETTPSMN